MPTCNDGPNDADLACERMIRRGVCPHCGGRLNVDGRDPAACDCGERSEGTEVGA